MRRTLLLVLVAALSGAVGGLVACWAAVIVTHQPGSAYFPDVSVTSSSNQDIGYMYEAGVVNGYPDGTYKPTDPVTREQMATYVTRTAVETYLLTMCSVDWNYFGGYFVGQQAYNSGRISLQEYQANQAAMAWATGATKYKLGQANPNAATAPLAATWLKYF